VSYSKTCRQFSKSACSHVYGILLITGFFLAEIATVATVYLSVTVLCRKQDPHDFFLDPYLLDALVSPREIRGEGAYY
jgi:hypothetical protein